jgi:hypothetical protein
MKLAEMKKELDDERKSKEDALKKEAEAAAGLKDLNDELEKSRQSKDIAEQQRTEMILQLEAERKSKEEAERKLDETKKQLENEHTAKEEVERNIDDQCKFKDEVEKKLDEMKKQLDDERKSKEDAMKKEAEAIAGLKDLYDELEKSRQSKDIAEQQLAEMALQLEAERKSMVEIKLHVAKMTTKMSALESKESPVVSITQKRKASSIEQENKPKRKKRMAQAGNDMECKLNDFLVRHVIANSDGFIASRSIQNEYEVEHSITLSTSERDTFLKLVKTYISEIFTGHDWRYTRKVCSVTKEKQYGYAGLSFD